MTKKRKTMDNQNGFIYDAKKVAFFLENRMKEVKTKIDNFNKNKDDYDDDEFYEIDSYLKHVRTDIIGLLKERLLKQEGKISLSEILRIFYSLWPSKVIKDIVDKDIEAAERSDEDVVVFKVSKDEWSFYMTLDYVDWEIWTNRFNLMYDKKEE